MNFDFEKIAPTDRYKLLTGIVVPRPIAWVTSLNEDGSVNAAPFSFFNVIGADPGLVVLGISNHSDRPKDTATNLIREKEFVVNLVPEQLAQVMSDSATDYPQGLSEISELNIATTPSSWVRPPRIEGCPAVLECVLEQVLQIGENRVLLGVILGAYVADPCMKDAQKFYVATEELHLIGRMGGLGGYTKTRDTFQIARKKFE